MERCKLFGVGLMSFAYERPDETFEVHVEPARKTPDPKETNDFLGRSLSDKGKGRLREMK